MNIKIQNLNKCYGNKIIFEDFNIEFEENKVNCIIGKSGCGKSTLLNAISGTTTKTSGEITGINNDISYIFQEDRLLNWLTVEENMELILKGKMSKEDIRKSIHGSLKLVGMEEHKKSYPESLSGGMRQRVNIARAFAFPSKIIIMDEPFKSIDLKNKKVIMQNFRDILLKEQRTVLFVTHEIDEAIFFENNIYVLGGSPVEIKGIFKNNLIHKKDRITSLI